MSKSRNYIPDYCRNMISDAFQDLEVLSIEILKLQSFDFEEAFEDKVLTEENVIELNRQYCLLFQAIIDVLKTF